MPGCRNIGRSWGPKARISLSYVRGKDTETDCSGKLHVLIWGYIASAYFLVCTVLLRRITRIRGAYYVFVFK